MLSVNAALHEQAKIVWGMGPKAPSTTVPDYVCLKGYSRCCIIITGLNTTTVTGSAITLKQASAVANTGEKALAFDKVFANLDVTATDTLVETAVSSNTFTTAATNSINFMYVIDVLPEVLGATRHRRRDQRRPFRHVHPVPGEVRKGHATDRDHGLVMQPYVAMGLPSRSAIRHRPDRLMGAALHAKGASNIPLVPFSNQSSLLNHCFNNLWAAWLHTLIKEMDRTGVDFLSAVAPIKDTRGLTSTATYQDSIWDFKRLTLKELHQMPETVEDAGGKLLLNTGCCLLRMRPDAEWVTNPRAFPFNTMERFDDSPLGDGDMVASVVSEDWLWTERLREAGARTAFTRKVALVHEGDYEFRNDSDWGRWESDKAYETRHPNENQVPENLQVRPERQGELAAV
jgi:hypothetical protein